MTQRIIDEESSDPELLLFLAWRQERASDKDAAMQTLHRAAALALGHEDASRIRNRIEEIGRRMTGNKKWEPPEVDEAMLQRAGFKLLPESGEAIMEVALSEAANFYDTQGKLTRHSIVVEPSRIPEGVFTLYHRTDSGSTHSTVHNPDRPWRGSTGFSSNDSSWRVEAIEIGDETFRVTLTRQEH